MPGDTGPTAQEIEYLNAISSGQQADPSTGQVIQSGAPATDTGGQISAMRNQIAQTMMARPQGGFSGGGGGGGDLYAAMRASMASRAPQGDPYATMRASMASRAPAGGGGGGGDPYAAMRASMASRAQPAAGGGGPTAGMWYDPTTPTGGNPWKTGPERNFLAEAMAYQEANPYDQYFGSRGPISGSPGEVDWLQNLQPWQQGGTSGGETTYQSQGSIFPGYLGAGGALRADPNYWGYTGPGTGWGTDQNSRLLWEQLRQNNPFAFQQLGGQGGMDAGIAGGFGPGGGPGGGGGGAGAGAGGGGGGVGGGSSAGPGGGGSSGGWGATGTGTIGGTAGGGFGAGATGVAGFGGAGGGYGNYGGFGGLGPAGPSSGAMGQVGVGLGIGTVGAPGTGIGEAFGPSSPGGWGAGAEGYSGYGAPGGFGGDTGEGFGGVW